MYRLKRMTKDAMLIYDESSMRPHGIRESSARLKDQSRCPRKACETWAGGETENYALGCPRRACETWDDSNVLKTMLPE